MKKLIGCIMALLFVGAITGVCFAAELGPVVSMGTPLVKMAGKKTAGVVIMGTGFKPGQEVRILIITQDGVETDIWSRMKPAPKADATGTWASTWNAGQYVSRKLIKDGVYKIAATDDNYILIAHAPIFFQKPKKDKGKKK